MIQFIILGSTSESDKTTEKTTEAPKNWTVTTNMTTTTFSAGIEIEKFMFHVS